DEGLEGARERVVRVVDENRALPQLGEKLLPGCAESPGDDRQPWLVFQIGSIEREELVQLGKIEQSGNEVDLVVVHDEPAFQLLQHPRRARAGDLDAYCLAEAAAAQ